MRTALRKIGNSTGMIVPQALLEALGSKAGEAIELSVEKGRLIAAPVRPDRPRAGWADAARALAEAGEVDPAWPEVANDDDAALMVTRGEVWLAALDPTVGSEIQKTRPCLIVSPEELDAHLKTVIVVPMTTGSRRAVPGRCPVSG